MNTQNGMSDAKVKLPLPPFSITAKDFKAYDLAKKTAALSDCRYKMGAVIIGKGGKVLSIGNNILKSHSQHIHWPTWVVSIHAEMRAIIKANCDIRGSTIYICRLGGNEISRPCDHCMACIIDAGIRSIVYSNGTNLVKMRV